MARYPHLETAAKYLKSAAPREFSELVRQLDAICHDLRSSLVNSDHSAIWTVQGRAQQADDLLAALDQAQTNSPQRQ